MGCGAVVFPLNCFEPEEKIMAFKEAAEQEGLIIAEVGVWKMSVEMIQYIIDEVNPKMPMIIEHLHSDEEYYESLAYVQNRLGNFIKL